MFFPLLNCNKNNIEEIDTTTTPTIDTGKYFWCKIGDIYWEADNIVYSRYYEGQYFLKATNNSDSTFIKISLISQNELHLHYFGFGIGALRSTSREINITKVDTINNIISGNFNEKVIIYDWGTILFVLKENLII